MCGGERVCSSLVWRDKGPRLPGWTKEGQVVIDGVW